MIGFLIHPAVGITSLMLAATAVLGTMMVTELGVLEPRRSRGVAAAAAILTTVAVAIVVLRFVVMPS